MTIAPVQGKEAKLAVGAGYDEVLGTRNANPDQSWNSEDIMHFGDDNPSTMLNYKQWSIPVTATLDREAASNAGQKACYDSFDAGTSLVFKLYPDRDVTTSYYSGTCVVTDWKETQDAQKINVVTFTMKPYLGSALTWNHA